MAKNLWRNATLTVGLIGVLAGCASGADGGPETAAIEADRDESTTTGSPDLTVPRTTVSTASTTLAASDAAPTTSSEPSEPRESSATDDSRGTDTAEAVGVVLRPSQIEALFAEEAAAYDEIEQVFFGYVGDIYHSIVVPSGDIWTFDDEDLKWELEVSLDSNVLAALLDSHAAQAWFADVTGEGLEDIVIFYAGGRRMMGDIYVQIDGEWTFIGSGMRPEFAAPGLTSLTYMTWPEGTLPREDETNYYRWNGTAFESCLDESGNWDYDFDQEAPSCDYWTGG